jgi:hypothetical protein
MVTAIPQKNTPSRSGRGITFAIHARRGASAALMSLLINSSIQHLIRDLYRSNVTLAHSAFES